MADKSMFDFDPVYKVWAEGLDQAQKEMISQIREDVTRIRARQEARRRFVKKARWWSLVVVHNCVAHPLLTVAEMLDAVVPDNRVSDALDNFHDNTVPQNAE